MGAFVGYLLTSATILFKVMGACTNKFLHLSFFLALSYLTDVIRKYEIYMDYLSLDFKHPRFQVPNEALAMVNVVLYRMFF